MNSKNTVQKQPPGDPLRAKYSRKGKTIILIVTDASENDIRRAVEIFRDAQHQPHWMQ